MPDRAVIPQPTPVPPLRGDGKLWSDRPLRGTPLTKRERKIINALVNSGCTSSREIAAQVGLAHGTVKVYFSRIFAKTGARNRAELYLRELAKPQCSVELQRHMSIPPEELEWHRALRSLSQSCSTDLQIIRIILERWKSKA